MISLIWKNIARRRVQSALTVTITALTVLVFVTVMAVLLVTTQGLALSRDRLGADAILVPKYSSATGGDLLFTAIPENIYMSKDTIQKVQELDGIAAMTPQFYAQTFDLSCCDTGQEVRLVGYDPETDFILSAFFTPGQQHVQGNEVIVGSNFKENLVGEQYLILGKFFPILSQISPTGTGMDDMYFMSMDTLRALCLSSIMIAPDWEGKDPYDCISVIMIRFSEGVDPQAFVTQIENSDIDARCILTGETISTLQNQLNALVKVMFALWLACLAIAILALTGRFNALAKGRRKEIGLLRAIGLKKNQIFGLIIGETCTMALIGGILGSGIALLCMNTVIALIKDIFMLSPSIWNSRNAMICAVCGILLAGFLGFISAVYPAWKSASMDPQKAITQGEAV